MEFYALFVLNYKKPWLWSCALTYTGSSEVQGWGVVSEYLCSTDTTQCLPDMDHPIKLPNLFWDGNGEEFALHSRAPWHVLPSQGEEPDADQFADDLCCWQLWSAELPDFCGLKSATLCACCSWQSSADFEGKKWLLSRLSIPWEGTEHESDRDSTQWIITCYQYRISLCGSCFFPLYLCIPSNFPVEIQVLREFKFKVDFFLISHLLASGHSVVCAS